MFSSDIYAISLLNKIIKEFILFFLPDYNEYCIAKAKNDKLNKVSKILFVSI